MVRVEVVFVTALASETVIEELTRELAILSEAPDVKIVRVPLLAPWVGDVVAVDRFVKVKLPVAEILLSDMLGDVSGTVAFGKVTEGSERVFEVSPVAVLPDVEPDDALVGTVDSTDDPVRLSIETVKGVDTVAPDTDVRDTLDNVPVDSSPGPVLPPTELLLIGSELVAAEVADMLEIVKDVSVTGPELPLDAIPEAELSVTGETVSDIVTFLVTLEIGIDVEETSLFVPVLLKELILDNVLAKEYWLDITELGNEVLEVTCDGRTVEPDNGGDSVAGGTLALICEDIGLEKPDACELGDPDSIIGRLVSGPEEPGTLAVTGPFVAEVKMLGNIVLVRVKVGNVITVIDSDVKLVVEKVI